MVMGMQVRKGAKVSWTYVYGDTIVGVVVGFGGANKTTPLVMASGEFVRDWMHAGNAFELYEEVGGVAISLPVEDRVYWYVNEDHLKVLGYE